MRTYTPLRYPGGKAKLYDFVKEMIETNFTDAPIYVEGFAGGSGLALKLLSTGVVSKIYLNDYDYAISCIWYAMKYHNKKFIELINNAVFTIDEWNYQKSIYLNSKNKKNNSKLEVGFATFYLNRTNRSGIILAGPIGGKNQDGNYKMDCRFNKKQLIKIVENFNKHKNNIHVYNRDAYKFIQYIEKNNINDLDNIFFYLDPPYVNKGPGLYKNSFDKNKHMELRDSIIKLESKWFVTYDNDSLIHDLYSSYRIQPFTLTYVMQESRKGEELAIFSSEIKIRSKMEIKI